MSERKHSTGDAVISDDGRAFGYVTATFGNGRMNVKVVEHESPLFVPGQVMRSTPMRFWVPAAWSRVRVRADYSKDE